MAGIASMGFVLSVRTSLFALGCCLLLGGCGEDKAGDSRTPDPGYSSPTYSDPKMWLCGATADHNYCLDPQTATEVRPDGTQGDVAIPPAASPTLDCFYVYPTVAITDPVGNRQDFDNVSDILDPLMAQAAPFNQVCTVFAPLYRQITLNTYQDPDAQKYLDTAYEDVVEAFRHYIDQFSHGRTFALIGHSQGAHMLRRLLQREIEPKPELLSRLVVALPIGSVGDIVVPKGGVVGGSFAKIPLCTDADERGCVIAFNTFGAGYEPTTTGMNLDPAMDSACTNPVTLGGSKARLTASFFPTKVRQALLDPKIDFGITTSFAVYRDFFTAECAVGPPGDSYLRVAAEPQSGDARTNPIPFDAGLFSPGPPFSLGLHLLDFAFPTEDLVNAVRSRSPAK